MTNITLGSWIVEFPEEMDKSEINRIIIKVFRILESDGITITQENTKDKQTSTEIINER
jgi:hypothetical protein|tara:strand:+ start:261 stop:437 length:177 start_codon:yes stop_codon:yes gene_type:complete